MQYQWVPGCERLGPRHGSWYAELCEVVDCGGIVKGFLVNFNLRVSISCRSFCWIAPSSINTTPFMYDQVVSEELCRTNPSLERKESEVLVHAAG